MIEDDMVARLEAAPTLTAQIATRLYPVEAPPNATLPYLIYHRAPSNAADNLNGGAVDTIPIAFEAHAAEYDDARAIIAALRPVLDDWREDAPATLMSMTYVGEHDGAGEYNEEQRRRRSHCREAAFIALCRA